MNYLIKVNTDYKNELIDVMHQVIYETFLGFFKESNKFKKRSFFFKMLLNKINEWDKKILFEIFANIQIHKCKTIYKLIKQIIITQLKIHNVNNEYHILQSTYYLHQLYLECINDSIKQNYLFICFSKNKIIECKLFLKNCLEQAIHKWVPIQNLLELKEKKLNNQYKSIRKHKEQTYDLSNNNYVDHNITHIVNLE